MPRTPWYINSPERVEAVIDALKPRSGSQAESEGTVWRGPIRHVMFSIETTLHIFSLACQHPAFYKQCHLIGQTAARKLWQHFAELSTKDRVVIPADFDRLIQVWCDWDISGGWGKFTLTPMESSGGTGYRARIAKNFLGPLADSLAAIAPDKIHNFWRGYIGGFLDDAIIHAYEPIYEAEPQPEQRRLRLMSYQAVSNVIAIVDEDEDADITEQFAVHLAPHPWFQLWDHLGSAYAALKTSNRNEESCADKCVHVMQWVRDWLRMTETPFDLDDDLYDLALCDSDYDCVSTLIKGRPLDDGSVVYSATRSFVLLLRDYLRGIRQGRWS